jgi:transcriptional repressor NrdR
VKKGGDREPWDRDKLLHGLRLACRKRPITEEQVGDAAMTVEQRVQTESEVTTSDIGEQVMEVLRGLDAVAYVRFASVYKAFESVEQFADAIRASAPSEAEAEP